MSSVSCPPGATRLLVDNEFVADVWEIRRHVATPRKHPGPVLEHRHDAPWGGISYPGVVRDPRDGTFHLWYSLGNHAAAQKKSEYYQAGRIDDYFAYIGAAAEKTTVTGYARSRDGIVWEQPKVGQGPFQGTNIVFGGHTHGQGQVWLDLEETDPQRRFKMIYCDWLSPGNGGHCLAFSPDGIHWTPYANNPFIYGESDSNNTLIRNPCDGGYLLYMRPWDCAAWKRLDYNRNTRRRIAVARGRTLFDWDEPINILHPDEIDRGEFYGMTVFHRHDVFFGLLSEYSHHRQTMDVQLAFSRDGLKWDRLPQRPCFLPRGGEGEFDNAMIIPAFGTVEVDGDLRFYYNGRPTLHDDNSGQRIEDSAVGLAVAPMGRLIGRRADGQQGFLLTHPLVIDGDELRLDAQVPGHGQLTVEVVEPDKYEPGGKTVPGFGAADCAVIQGNAVDLPVTWKGRSLAALRGKRVRLRFGMKVSTLYSFTILTPA